jgi:hypothetical protein
VRMFLTICAVLLGLCLTFGCARAEVDSTEILIKALVNKGIITQQDAEAVRDEIAELKKEEEAKKTSFTVTGKRPIKVAGYLHEKFTSSSEAGVSDGFEVRRARLGLTGDATDKLDFKVSWELSGARTAVSSVDFGGSTVTTTKVGKPILVDMALGYKLPNDRRIQIGQFHIPFSIESISPASKIDFINRPRVVDTLVPGRDTGNMSRDQGLQYSGATSGGQVQYFAALFNGAGINATEDNNHKDPALRLVYNSPKGLWLGASYFNGALGAAETARRRLGFEAIYDRKDWALKGEYIRADDAAGDADGWYGTVLHRFSPKLDGIIRYDLFDPNKDAGDDAFRTLTAGLNWKLNKDGYSRWQLNYEWKREEGPQVSNNQLLAQFQAGF